MSQLPLKIKTKLQEKRLSAHALEKLAGLKPSVVQNILQGKSKNPTAHTLQAISQVLDCPVDDLLSGNATKEQPRVEWNAAIYQEATQIAHELFTAKKLNLSKEQALNYIDEIYNYSMLGGHKHIDKQFAEWLINKQYF